MPDRYRANGYAPRRRSADAANFGVVAFDFTSGEPTEQYFVDSTTGSLSAGDDLGAGAVLDRTYSIEATAGVPEPSIRMMLLIGFGGLGLALRRRPARVSASA